MKFLRKREPIKLPKSIEKLEESGFDPIQEMVNLYDAIDAEIRHLLYDDFGERRAKYSAIAYAQLVAQQQSISNNLLRYGYARVTETAEPVAPGIPTISITLTDYAPKEK